jgi:hypothetical protein
MAASLALASAALCTAAAAAFSSSSTAALAAAFSASALGSFFASSGSEKKTFVECIIKEFAVHAAIEEQVLYIRVRASVVTGMRWRKGLSVGRKESFGCEAGVWNLLDADAGLGTGCSFMMGSFDGSAQQRVRGSYLDVRTRRPIFLVFDVPPPRPKGPAFSLGVAFDVDARRHRRAAPRR